METSSRFPLAERGDDVQLASTPRLTLFGRTFVVLAEHDELIRRIEREFVDLHVLADEHATLEYRVARLGPDWLSHSWGVWRDGELLRDAVVEEFLPTFIVGDVIGSVIESTPELVGFRGSTLTLLDRTVLLVDAVGQTSATSPSWWNEMALVASMMTNGWSLVASGSSVLPIDESGPGPVRSCWRPLLLREDHSAESTSTGVVTPASGIGPLASAAVLDAVFILRAQPGPESRVETLTPAATLYELSSVLMSTEEERRRDFVRLVTMVERLPSFVLHVGTEDLSGASAAISSVVRSIS